MPSPAVNKTDAAVVEGFTQQRVAVADGALAAQLDTDSGVAKRNPREYAFTYSGWSSEIADGLLKSGSWWNVLTFQENAIRYLRFQVGLMDKADNVTMSKANASSSGIQTGQVLPIAIAVALLLPALALLLLGFEPAPLLRLFVVGCGIRPLNWARI